MNKYQQGEFDVRPWGEWKVLFSSHGIILKQIIVNPGHRLSLQRHQYRDEVWHISEGIGNVVLGEVETTLSVGDLIQIPKGEVHRIWNKSTEKLVFHEFQKGEVLDEADIERLDDDYERV